MRTLFRSLLILLPALVWGNPLGPHGENTASVYNEATGRRDFITDTSTITVSKLHFQSVNCVITAADGTCLLSMPDVNSMYFGYNTNLVNTGGVFNYAGGPTCMPYPGAGNFNSCVGPFGMSGNVITIAENNNSQGYAACGALRAGFYNSCFGGSSGNLLRDGNYNTFSGAYAGSRLTDANGNTHVGFESSKLQTSGDYVTSVGFQACGGTTTLNANVSGSGLTCLGKQTGQDVPSATAISNSFAVGIGALYNASGEGQLGGRVGSGTEVLVRMASGTVETSFFQVAGRNVCLADGTNCPVAGSGSASTLAVTTGTTAGWVGPAVSSPTAAVNFDQGQFKASLQGGATAFISIRDGISTVSGNFTIGSTSTVILANATGAPLTVTLPTAVGLEGKKFTVKRTNSGANGVIVATTSSQTIDGTTTITLAAQYDSVDLISDNANWSLH